MKWTAKVTWPNGVSKSLQMEAASVESAMLKAVLWSMMQRAPVRNPNAMKEAA